MPRAPRSSSSSKRKSRAGAPDIRLTGDRLVVEVPGDGERRSRSGLLIPATAASAPKRLVWASVVLTGPEVRNVQKGDHVLFLPQVGLEMEIEGEDFLLLRERDVQAVSSPGSADGKDTQAGQYL